MKNFLAILTVFLTFLPFSAAAETVVRIGDSAVVDDTQVVDGDYYVSVGPFGDTTMSGLVSGDMYAFGGAVTTNGIVAGDLSTLSGVTQLHASVTDDVRIVSAEVMVGEDIGGDLFVIGGVLKVLSTATIAGNVYFFGGEAVIDGDVKGSIHGSMKRIRIDSAVGDGVDVLATESLTLGSRADISGNVKYQSNQSIKRAPEAVVEGDVTRANSQSLSSNQESLQDALVPLFIALFAALSIYLLFREELPTVYHHAALHPTRSVLLGLGVVILGPFVSVLLIVTVLGLLLGLAGLATVVLLLALGYALAGTICGAFLAKALTKEPVISWLWITTGTCFLYGVGFIPVIGPFFVFFFFVLTIGGLATSFYKLLQ